MKKNILVTLVLLAQITFGQKLIETRTATLVDGDYSLDGTVYLELFDDDSLDLRFDSDYKTSTNVFDVHVYLSTDNNFQKPIDTSEMLLVENIGTMTGLNYSSGARTFDLPAGVGINDYKYVVFVCVFYNRLHWGNGTFGSVTLNTVAFEDESTNAVDIFPNPSEDGFVKFHFKNQQKNILVEVFNIRGQIISSKRVYNKKQHFIELKDSGIYLLKLATKDATMVRKIIKL